MIDSVSMVNNDSDVLEDRLQNSCFSCKLDEIKRILRSDSSNKFNLLLQNIRSFNKNFDELSVYLNDYMENIDIMAFSETWHTEDLCTTINTYNDYHTVRAKKRGRSLTLYQ